MLAVGECDVGCGIARHGLSLSEKLLDRVGRTGFQHGISSETVRDLALDSFGAANRVDAQGGIPSAPLRPVPGRSPFATLAYPGRWGLAA